MPGHRHLQCFSAGPFQADHRDWRHGLDAECKVSRSLPHPAGDLYHPDFCAVAQHVNRIDGGDGGSRVEREQEDLEASGQIIICRHQRLHLILNFITSNNFGK